MQDDFDRISHTYLPMCCTYIHEFEDCWHWNVLSSCTHVEGCLHLGQTLVGKYVVYSHTRWPKDIPLAL